MNEFSLSSDQFFSRLALHELQVVIDGKLCPLHLTNDLLRLRHLAVRYLLQESAQNHTPKILYDNHIQQ